MALETREWVEARRADLAKRAWAFADRSEIKAALAGLNTTALRTLLGAAMNASCFLEVLILLRYQQGRARDRDRDGKSSQESQLKVLCPAIEKELQASVAAANEALGPAQHADVAEARLAAAWLGFLVQLHRFYRPDDKDQSGRQERK
jgi:hypothetical protein